MENWNASHVTKGSVMDSSYILPHNVALITLQVTVNRCRIDRGA